MISYAHHHERHEVNRAYMTESIIAITEAKPATTVVA